MHGVEPAETPRIWTWRGKPVREMTRDEAIAALERACETLRKNMDRDIEKFHSLGRYSR